MREHAFRIHYLCFTNDGSVSEYVFQNIVHYIRSNSYFWKCYRAVRTCFSHPPPVFYEWGECLRVCVLKSTSVQTVPHSSFENVTVPCENKRFASIICCLWVRRVSQSCVLKSSSVKSVPQPVFENLAVQWKNTFFASNNCSSTGQERVSEYVF